MVADSQTSSVAGSAACRGDANKRRVGSQRYLPFMVSSLSKEGCPAEAALAIITAVGARSGGRERSFRPRSHRLRPNATRESESPSRNRRQSGRNDWNFTFWNDFAGFRFGG